MSEKKHKDLDHMTHSELLKERDRLIQILINEDPALAHARRYIAVKSAIGAIEESKVSAKRSMKQ